MKNTNLIKVIAFCSAIAISSVDAAAQATNQTAAPTMTESAATSTRHDDDRPNYSWIGLLGLLGLAGLLRKRHEDRVHVPAGTAARHS